MRDNSTVIPYNVKENYIRFLWIYATNTINTNKKEPTLNVSALNIMLRL